MNRKSTSSIGSHGRAAKTDALLGFSVWITPFRGAMKARAWAARMLASRMPVGPLLLLVRLHPDAVEYF